MALHGDGNYRVTLPPGDYILDVQGRTFAREAPAVHGFLEAG